MRKIFSIIIIAVMMMTGLVIFSGCGNKNEDKNKSDAGYNKEMNEYTVKSANDKGELTFKLAKDLNYEPESKSGVTFRLTSKDNMSDISVHIAYDYETSATITKKEKDFYSDKYHDFKEVTVGEHKGWSIYYGESQYEMGLVLTDRDADNKVYGITINVRKSPVMKENMSFDVKEFVESEDFKQMLQSMNITVNE